MFVAEQVYAVVVLVAADDNNHKEDPVLLVMFHGVIVDSLSLSMNSVQLHGAMLLLVEAVATCSFVAVDQDASVAVGTG